MIRNVLTSIAIVAMLCGCAGNWKYVRRPGDSNASGNPAYDPKAANSNPTATTVVVAQTKAGSGQSTTAPSQAQMDAVIKAAQSQAESARVQADAMSKLVADLQTTRAEVDKLRSDTQKTATADGRDALLASAIRGADIKDRLRAEQLQEINPAIKKVFDDAHIVVVDTAAVHEGNADFQQWILSYGGFTAKVKFRQDFGEITGYWHRTPRAGHPDAEIIEKAIKAGPNNLGQVAWDSFVEEFRYGEIGTVPVAKPDELVKNVKEKVADPFRARANTP